MKTYRVIPAALVVSLMAVGGASSALAMTNGDQGLDLQMSSGKTWDVTSTLRQGPAWKSYGAVKLTFDQAQKMAEQKIGGKTIASGWFGPRNEQYKFDIKSGGKIQRVFVNGHTGKMTIAASLDPGIDPSVIGSGQKDYDAKDEPGEG